MWHYRITYASEMHYLWQTDAQANKLALIAIFFDLVYSRPPVLYPEDISKHITVRRFATDGNESALLLAKEWCGFHQLVCRVKLDRVLYMSPDDCDFTAIHAHVYAARKAGIV